MQVRLIAGRRGFAIWVVLYLIGAATAAPAQYVSFLYDNRGAIVSVTYQGNSDWLVAQEEDESKWQRFPKLRSVALINHTVSDPAAEYIGGLAKLKSLTIGTAPEGVGISRHALGSLGRLRSLQELELCVQNLRERDLSFLERLTDLRYLTIESHSSNKEPLGQISGELIGNLPSLVDLELQGHVTDKLVSKVSRRGSKLRKLNVFAESGQVTDRALGLIALRLKLEELGVGSKKVTGRGVKHLAKMKSLKRLRISAGTVTHDAVRSLSVLPHLVLLELPGRSLDRATVSAVADLQRLQGLSVPQATLLDAAFEELRDHSSLKTIWIDGSELTTASLAVVRSMPRLESINLGRLNGTVALQTSMDAILRARRQTKR
jgi:hypothetical protein